MRDHNTSKVSEAVELLGECNASYTFMLIDIEDKMYFVLNKRRIMYYGKRFQALIK